MDGLGRRGTERGEMSALVRFRIANSAAVVTAAGNGVGRALAQALCGSSGGLPGPRFAISRIASMCSRYPINDPDRVAEEPASRATGTTRVASRAEVPSDSGAIDVLVPNAGVTAVRPLVGHALAGWD